MSQRRGPPAHQNKVAWEPFRADKHNSAKKIIEQQPVDGVCAKCAEIIQWKKNYGKYKPLRQPAKCVDCQQRRVDLPYRQLCHSCAGSRRYCAKCMNVLVSSSTSATGEDEGSTSTADAPLGPFLRSMQAAPGQREGDRRPVRRGEARARSQAAAGVGRAAQGPREGCSAAVDDSTAARQESTAIGEPAGAGAPGVEDFDALCDRLLAAGRMTTTEYDELTDMLATGRAAERDLCEQLNALGH